MRIWLASVSLWMGCLPTEDAPPRADLADPVIIGEDLAGPFDQAAPNWRLVPSGTTKDLNGVWGAASNDYWAVGQDGVILRWNGSRWSVHGTSAPASLYAVWGSRTLDVHAVGANGLTMRYLGDWQISPPSVSNYLRAVRDNVAVGDGGTVLAFVNEVWSPVTWSGTKPSSAFYTTASGAALGVSSAIACGAVGSSWSPYTGSGYPDLYGAWRSGIVIYAVGDGGYIGRDSGCPTSLSRQTSNVTANLKAVYGTSSTNIFAVGDGGTILRYDGSAWRPMMSGTTANLRAIWGTPESDGAIWVVGQGGTILRYVP